MSSIPQSTWLFVINYPPAGSKPIFNLVSWTFDKELHSACIHCLTSWFSNRKPISTCDGRFTKWDGSVAGQCKVHRKRERRCRRCHTLFHSHPPPMFPHWIYGAEEAINIHWLLFDLLVCFYVECGSGRMRECINQKAYNLRDGFFLFFFRSFDIYRLAELWSRWYHDVIFIDNVLVINHVLRNFIGGWITDASGLGHI